MCDLKAISMNLQYSLIWNFQTGPTKNICCAKGEDAQYNNQMVGLQEP